MSKFKNNTAIEEFTEAERAKLVEFRKRVQKFYPKTDAQLVIWLRARGLNVVKAEKMLRRHLVWRRNNQADQLLEWRSAKVYAPYIYLGNDYVGAPVFLFPLGQYEIKGAIECGEFVPALRYLYQAIEYCVSIANVQNASNGIVIVDCEGFRYNQFTNRFLVQAALELGRMVEANYPELLKVGIILNAPRIFNALFSIIKPVLASQTISKIHIYGSDRSKWLGVLKKLMPEEVLPPYWGGTRPGSDEFCSESWFQEPLPRYFMRRLDTVYDDYGQEWISLKIAAGECLTFEYDISELQLQQDPVLNWAYYTDGYDLAFGLTFEGDDLLELKRVNSHKGKQSGSHVIEKPGKYVLKFDNSYSRTRSKILHYVISLSVEDEAETAIIVRTPSGSTRALNGNGMATLGLPVPTRNYLNGSHSSLASSCCSCGSSTNISGTAGDEKEFLDAVEDLKIDPYLESGKKSIKAFF